MKLIHFSRVDKINDQSEFRWTPNGESPISTIHRLNYLGDRNNYEKVVFSILEEWQSFSHWTCYGKPYFIELNEELIISMGYGSVNHRLVKLSEFYTNAVLKKWVRSR